MELYFPKNIILRRILMNWSFFSWGIWQSCLMLRHFGKKIKVQGSIAYLHTRTDHENKFPKFYWLFKFTCSMRIFDHIYSVVLKLSSSSLNCKSVSSVNLQKNVFNLENTSGLDTFRSPFGICQNHPSILHLWNETYFR